MGFSTVQPSNVFNENMFGSDMQQQTDRLSATELAGSQTLLGRTDAGSDLSSIQAFLDSLTGPFSEDLGWSNNFP